MKNQYNEIVIRGGAPLTGLNDLNYSPVVG